MKCNESGFYCQSAFIFGHILLDATLVSKEMKTFSLFLVINWFKAILLWQRNEGPLSEEGCWKGKHGVPVVVQQDWCSGNQCELISLRMQVRYLASLSGPGIQRCCELWCRSQKRLGSRVSAAVAVVWAGSFISDSTPTLRTSICHGCGPKKKTKKG